MGWFDSVIQEYLLPEPKGFVYIAARLKAGASPLEVRDELIEKTGASRLAAGKLVEHAQRAIKVARGNMLSGTVVVLLGFWLLLTGSLWGVAGLVFGSGQFAAGRKVWSLYGKAGE